MNRITVKICARYPEAWDLHKVLSDAGVDAKIVTKHAVQIHPLHIDKARAAIIAEEEKRKSTPWQGTVESQESLQT